MAARKSEQRKVAQLERSIERNEKDSQRQLERMQKDFERQLSRAEKDADKRVERTERSADKRVEKLEKDSEKRAARIESEIEQRLALAESESGDYEARLRELEAQLEAAGTAEQADPAALKARDAEIVRLEVQLAEVTANSDNLALQEQLQEHIDRTAQLEELVTQLETERDDEIKGLEEKLRAEIESLERREREEQRFAEHFDLYPRLLIPAALLYLLAWLSLCTWARRLP